MLHEAGGSLGPVAQPQQHAVVIGRKLDQRRRGIEQMSTKARRFRRPAADSPASRASGAGGDDWRLVAVGKSEGQNEGTAA